MIPAALTTIECSWEFRTLTSLIFIMPSAAIGAPIAAKLTWMLLPLAAQVDTVGPGIPVMRNGKEMLESEGV